MNADLDILGLGEVLTASVVAPVPPTPSTIPMASGDTGTVGDGTEIMDPTTGELIDRADIDALIDAYERISFADSQMYAAKCEIRKSLAALTEGVAKTRRVQGHRRKAVVEMPSDSWDSKLLKQAWETWPDLRDQALRIETIGVKAREYAKLKNTSGTPELEAFRNALDQANRGPTGIPTVKIET